MGKNFNGTQKMLGTTATGRTGEADHMIPYSKGGETTYQNMMITTQHANRKKSDTLITLRDWQQKCLDEYKQTKHEKDDFTIEAVPAAGKTIVALSIARDFLNNGARRRVVFVSPSIEIAYGFQEKAIRFAIELCSSGVKSSRATNEYHGCTTTYQAIASGSNAQDFSDFCKDFDVLVILDEIHHCGANLWGKSAKTAFENASKRIVMTGTGWRSDGSDICFTKTNADGKLASDFKYSLSEAMADNVVRDVVIKTHKGKLFGGAFEDDQLLDRDQPLDTAQPMLRRMTVACNYTKGIISDLLCSIRKCRETCSDAAGMIVVRDIEQAKKFEKLCKNVFHITPCVVTSDDDQSHKKIAEFRNSDDQLLISVKMVSEGVDIPRLQTIALLITETTQLNFEQLIGRVMRYRGLDDYQAIVHIPDDPRLVENADYFLKEKQRYYEQQFNNTEASISEDGENFLRQLPLMNTITPMTEHLGLNSEIHKDGELNTKDLQFIDKHNLDKKDFILMREYHQNNNFVNSEQSSDTEQKPLEHRKKDLQIAIQDYVKSIAYRFNLTHNDVHIAACVKAFGKFIATKLMDESQLVQKLKVIRSREFLNGLRAK